MPAEIAIEAPRRTNVGLIGCGAIAQTHCREYYGTNPSEAQLVACADPQPAMRQRVSEQYRIPSYADTAELLARSDVDVVDGFKLSVFPVKGVNTSGAPVRAVAIIEDVGRQRG